MAHVAVISVPYHVGIASHRVGAGPDALLAGGLVAALHAEGATSSVQVVAPVDDHEGEIGRSFELLRRVSVLVSAARARGSFPLVVAGNCMTTVGVMAGLAPTRAGLAWFDAHPDFDTPDEHRSGYLDGMGAAIVTGQCWTTLARTVPGFTALPLDRLVYCGVRDFEPGQREKVERLGVRAAIGSTDRRVDYADRFRRALSNVAFDQVVVHIDLDVLDAELGRANDYAATGGLDGEELDRCLDLLVELATPVAMTFASLDPGCPGATRLVPIAVAAARRVVQRVS